MVGPLVANRIRDWFPHTRLIAMVRDPVDRLFSECVPGWHVVALTTAFGGHACHTVSL